MEPQSFLPATFLLSDQVPLSTQLPIPPVVSDRVELLESESTSCLVNTAGALYSPCPVSNLYVPWIP